MLIATRVTCGPLRREILRFIESQPEDRAHVPWARVKEHIERTFLSADENEQLRVSVEELSQKANETLASFNRRFREAVQRAYPAPRSGDAERIVMRQYMRGLRSEELVQRLNLELSEETLEAAMKFTERMEAGMERYMGLNRVKRREEPMEVAHINPMASHINSAAQSSNVPSLNSVAPNSNDSAIASALVKIQKGQEKLAARLSRIESHVPAEPRYPKNNRRFPSKPSPSGQGQSSDTKHIACFICGGNHYRAGCPQRPPPQRRVQPATNTPAEN